MTTTLYFADVNGQTVRFDRADHRGAKLGGTFAYHRETAAWVKVERTVTYKSNPSRHECDARCINASGRTMNCECACGGKNHGRGAFNCEAVQ